MTEPTEIEFDIGLQLRCCTRCKHWECTHCRDFCDNGECIFDGGPCGDGKCQYDTLRDEAGYKRFDEKAEELRNDPQWSPWIGDTTREDGTVVIIARRAT